MEIDFVLAWVDGSDREWQKEKARYCGENIQGDDRKERYRDWDILKFWFRGVEMTLSSCLHLHGAMMPERFV